MRTANKAQLLFASCVLLLSACAEEAGNSGNPGNSSFTGSDTRISALTDAQIEAFCVASTEVFYQTQVSFECASPAIQAALTDMEPPVSCESDVTSCINSAPALDVSAPCEPAGEDESESPSCIYQECVTSITAQREEGCEATEAQVATCTNDSIAQVIFTPAQLCSGEAIMLLFGAEEGAEPTSCAELEMICPSPEG